MVSDPQLITQVWNDPTQPGDFLLGIFEDNSKNNFYGKIIPLFWSSLLTNNPAKPYTSTILDSDAQGIIKNVKIVSIIF